MKRLVALGIILSFALLACFDLDRSWPSPSSAYRLQTTVTQDKSDMKDYFCVKLHILNEWRYELFDFQTQVSDLEKWAAGWMTGRDIIVLASADTGTSAYIIENKTLKEIPVTNDIEKRADQLFKMKYGSDVKYLAGQGQNSTPFYEQPLVSAVSK